ncbi:lipoprotein, putative, partial [Vibrio cholerae O1 str. EDC-022]
KLTGW